MADDYKNENPNAKNAEEEKVTAQGGPVPPIELDEADVADGEDVTSHQDGDASDAPMELPVAEPAAPEPVAPEQAHTEHTVMDLPAYGPAAENPPKPDWSEKLEAALSVAGVKAKALLATRNGKIGAAVAAVLLVVCALFMSHTICFHAWTDATCTNPETCRKCGRTQGDPLGHDWAEATCTEPKTCKRCGETEGEPLGHEVIEWKVVKKATCTAKGKKEGPCVRCGEIQTKSTKMKDHVFGDWATTRAATCTSPGESTRVCKNCGKKETKSIALLDHTPGDWEVVDNVSVTSGGDVLPGTRVRSCTVCGTQLETQQFTLDITMSQKNALKTAASYLSWSGFSYKRLIEQLEFEGFSNADATFAADYCGADWYAQAEKSAESYMSWSSFSRERLIEQLEYEGFTHDQAVHGAESVGY